MVEISLVLGARRFVCIVKSSGIACLLHHLSALKSGTQSRVIYPLISYTTDHECEQHVVLDVQFQCWISG